MIANGIHDSEVLGDLLAETDASVEQVSGDGTYDTRHCYRPFVEARWLG